MRTLLFFIFFCLSIPFSLAQQPYAPIKKAVEDWLRIQNKGLPGEISVEISPLDPGNQLMPCSALDVSRPPGAKPWGRTNVMVRCLEEPGWRIYVRVHIRVKAPYLITARPIAHGELVVEEDLTTQVGDLSELPANILTEAERAIGKSASSSIPAGRPLRADMLRSPTVVRQGQSVRVLSRGTGFAVANEGRALNNAMEGQVVQVRLGSGQVVSGIAKAGGNVEVSY